METRTYTQTIKTDKEAEAYLKALQNDLLNLVSRGKQINLVTRVYRDGENMISEESITDPGTIISVISPDVKSITFEF